MSGPGEGGGLAEVIHAAMCGCIGSSAHGRLYENAASAVSSALLAPLTDAEKQTLMTMTGNATARNTAVERIWAERVAALSALPVGEEVDGNDPAVWQVALDDTDEDELKAGS